MEGAASISHEVNNSETLRANTRIWKRYCCIPQCDNNNRKNPEISFHKIQKNPELKKKWVRLLKRKGVREPGSSHRVCSVHFVGGKTCNNNVPTIYIFATAACNKPRKSPALRVTVECENNSVVPDVPTNLESSLATESDSCKNEDTIEKLKDDISQLQAKNMDF